ncbi:hypothetical protein [Pedobacter arcticus]|uniref:hypothetical protein n=1 Tax=Pedobacter arcticus TaxID=752140 RepID=UPI0003768040|nr:hypothetical protein [Pedobacter arcticus]
MSKLNYSRLWLVTLALSFSTMLQAQKKAILEIVCKKDATHIVGIHHDTLTVLSGSTYSYTVDTPENEGLVAIQTTVSQLLSQIIAKDGSAQQYQVINKDGSPKNEGKLVSGDALVVKAAKGKTTKNYKIRVDPFAIAGKLSLEQDELTVNTATDLTIYFTAGQRSPDATVNIFLPEGIISNLENTTVNVIGRGEVKLKDLAKQSIGRVGGNYSYSKVGNVSISASADGGSILTFSNLDLRPSNGADLKIIIRDVKLSKNGSYKISANYQTTQPALLKSAGIGAEEVLLKVKPTITSFKRIPYQDFYYKEATDTYTRASFSWNSSGESQQIEMEQSLDNGKTWQLSKSTIDTKNSQADIINLIPNKHYFFRLLVKNGKHKGYSNITQFYSGKLDVKQFGIVGDGKQDDTGKINKAILYLHQLGGGTLLFSEGVYQVRTVHLQSNIFLYVSKDATLKALKGADSPEATWFSDRQYRSGLSPTDLGPYENPENWLTKQDVGHTFFKNSMFFGERLNNVKIIGNGLITGDGDLVTSDKVMNNAPDKRADKMFSLKLCTNVEIGGIYRPEELWYDALKDEPYYLEKDGSKFFDCDNMLKIEQAGHFVLLATGTDHINVHDTYFAKYNPSNARDIYDFMACNNVSVTNIYSKISSDDIVKLGSDCSLGFTRPSGNYKIRNIIGDTNCNLFQIGSETADDIMDVCVDNIYVLGANKAGFSISTNDGGHVKNIHLNCGHTGELHSRSKMFRTTTPFFISISNRGRILGANAKRYRFTENGLKHDELLVTNVDIGKVENISINGIDIAETYAGSSFRGNRWKAYDGSQAKASPIVGGYALPKTAEIEGGLDFSLPNGLHTGYIQNIAFNDVHFLDKGGNPSTDREMTPPELGVGQYNVSNLKVQPAYGFWARHVKGLSLNQCTFNFEKEDSRYALVLDDVQKAKLSAIKMVKANDVKSIICLINSSEVMINDAVYYQNKWGNAPAVLPFTNHQSGVFSVFPSY